MQQMIFTSRSVATQRKTADGLNDGAKVLGAVNRAALALTFQRPTPERSVHILGMRCVTPDSSRKVQQGKSKFS